MAWTDSILNVIMIVGGAILVFAIVAGVIFWRLRKKGKGSAYKFLIYSRNDLQRPKVMDAYITNQENNKAQREFYLPEIKRHIGIKKPSKYIGNEAYREVIMNDRGDLDYLETTELKEKSIVQQLTPEVKQIVVNRLRMNAERYQNPMNKWSMLGLIGVGVMTFLIVVSAGYIAYSQGQSAKIHAEASKDLVSATKSLENTANSISEVTEMLTLVTSDLRGIDRNFTRIIS